MNQMLLQVILNNKTSNMNYNYLLVANNFSTDHIMEWVMPTD